MIGPRLGRATELRQQHDRHAQLLGQAFQRSRDRPELEDAVLEPAARLHQLHVIDDDQIQPVFGGEAAALRPHLEDADRGRVVDEDPGFTERADGLRQPSPVALAEKSAAQAMGVDARLAGQQPQEQLFLRHLEAEDADGQVGFGADVLRDIQREARLPHRRPGGDDHQVRRLQA